MDTEDRTGNTEINLMRNELQRLRSENANLRDNIDALIKQREHLKMEMREAAQLLQEFIDENSEIKKQLEAAESKS